MKITKQDLAPSRNMLKALGKGKWELDGIEILAFASMMQWFAALQKKIEEEVALEEARAKAEAVEKEKLASGVLEPKPVESPIKPIDANKKNKKRE
jgi:hypothetical protein